VLIPYYRITRLPTVLAGGSAVTTSFIRQDMSCEALVRHTMYRGPCQQIHPVALMMSNPPGSLRPQVDPQPVHCQRTASLLLL